ncbi:TetR/AcrR family transcriptional regulator [Phenylobacterium sp.]|uniref:TetR/AcrR family transcriptional regulator n=1 Tax=Phenylobacterium sp. TaxID=1871053 RepID=UPI0008D5BE24|nr:TetR/AcrR family transcriptional regulator [Phenylobacterium sp.]MBA4793458.1 TetR/AcrR family transcriptional regulator [Phenylobacterium sp.]OHB39818.1 MAG: TetR family transcriptional regulator [Phenylobacterium sp. RIFCSPHIGHO2_01_FULL_70_10]
MRESAAAETRPYHHGDLRRALVEAACRLLETEGPGALSLRAVAREAGVSPAAPYHHFKDKSELLDAVAHEGWEKLDAAFEAVRRSGIAPGHLVRELGVAYVCFAREHPALYRVMYDCSRDKADMPAHVHENEESAYRRVKETLISAGADPADEVGLELATIACWCAGHGLAEMASFKQFEPLKEALGGEEAFLRGVLEHLGVFARGLQR